MKRSLYRSTIKDFLKISIDEIFGILTKNSEFADELNQKEAWKNEIQILKDTLEFFEGSIYFEYSIPRMGRRIDVLLIIHSVIFVLEFKIGESKFNSYAVDQVWDYALDLKNFHETSHDKIIVPILIATNAQADDAHILSQLDKLHLPICCNQKNLGFVLMQIIEFFKSEEIIDPQNWEKGRYFPTPTIIEAAIALYNNHSVADISRNDASAINLSKTSSELTYIIKTAKEKNEKAICFLTGVPGAGKTLVGLNIATTHYEKESELYSVFLSGNGPLVSILQEALARDKVRRALEQGRIITKSVARSEVKAFIQNVHHFRDDCLKDNNPPIEHVALFDEAQRAWTLEQTSTFMRQKKGNPDFKMSEPEYLISCLDRHKDWAVIVCLVGGGQEINTGEAGIGEWIESLDRSFPSWKVYISNRIIDNEYNLTNWLLKLNGKNNVKFSENLHLAVSMRSFRAEKVSLLVKQILDLESHNAKKTFEEIKEKYPIVITRELSKAKIWLKQKARGSERYGIVVSSQAQRLKPYAIDVRFQIDPIHWFLDEKDDVRSSYYLEDVATEFQIQGLELDWVCVAWDCDLKYCNSDGWSFKSFRGNKWMNINNKNRRNYLKNAYRVLLTRARQGMVIVIPNGSKKDPTRLPEFYNDTYFYLKSIGFNEI